MIVEATTPVENAVVISNYKVSDEDLPLFTDLKFEHINELQLDHPGANDPQYRERRMNLALKQAALAGYRLAKVLDKLIK